MRTLSPVPLPSGGQPAPYESPLVAQALPEKPWESYLDILSRFRKLIIAVTAVVFLISLFFAFTAQKYFTASSVVRISTHTPVLPGTAGEDVIRQQTSEENYFATQVEEIKSLPLADAVLSDPEVAQDLEALFSRPPSLGERIKYYSNPKNWIPRGSESSSSVSDSFSQQEGGAPYAHSLKELTRYLSMISVTQVKLTALVEISATTPNGKLSSKIANAHARHYVNYTRSEQRASFADNAAFLEQQARELEGRIAATERNLADYAETHSIVALDNNETIITRHISELNRLLTEATARRIGAENNFKQAETQLGRASNFVDDSSASDVKQKLAEAEAEYARESRRFTSEYPKMVELRARIGSLRKELSSQRQQSINSLETRYNAEKQIEEQLREQLEAQKTNLFDLSKVEVQYNQMTREFDSLKDLHQTVLRQLKQAQLSSGGNRSNVTIAQKAPEPFAPAGPRRSLMIAVGMFLGPILGFGIAWLLSFFDTSIRSTDEAARLLKIPEIGMIPSIEKKLFLDERGRESSISGTLSPVNHPPSVSRTLFSVHAPRSAAAESLRSIRAAIRLSSPDKRLKVLLVTSALEREGKTTVASNLALAFAQDSSRTLLIDGDLRRPSLSHLFGIDSEMSGLANVISGQVELGEAIHATEYPHLSVLPAGSLPPHPAELIGSRKMHDLVTLLSEHFDQIIIDSCPVLPVADSLVLSSMVDGTLIVLRSNVTSRKAASLAVARLQQARARVIGSVLNGVNLDRADVAFLYRTSYSYTSSDNVRWASNE
jgi:polysaccharide biosynthesis transport protein